MCAYLKVLKVDFHAMAINSVHKVSVTLLNEPNPMSANSGFYSIWSGNKRNNVAMALMTGGSKLMLLFGERDSHAL